MSPSSADQANRLKSATVSGVTSEFTYDGDGKRLKKTVGNSEYNYFYDVNRSLPAVLEDEFRRNVWGNELAYAVDIHLLSFAPNGQRASSPEAPSSYPGQILVYHNDGLGSVRAITDTSSNVIETYETDEFGVVTGASGSVDQPFGYAGEIRDTGTGLVYLRSRYYDPYLNRFIQPDRIVPDFRNPQTLNRYTYALNNPVRYTDPSGNWPEPIDRVIKWFANAIRAAGRSDALPSRYDTVSPSHPAPICTSPKDVAKNALSVAAANTQYYGIDDDPLTAAGVERALDTAFDAADAFKGLERRSDSRYGDADFVVGDRGVAVERDVIDQWDQGTFDNELDSLRYHFDRHGAGRTPREYTEAAVDFYNQNSGDEEYDLGIRRWNPDWEPSRRIEVDPDWGGYYSDDGRVRSYWDN